VEIQKEKRIEGREPLDYKVHIHFCARFWICKRFPRTKKSD